MQTRHLTPCVRVYVHVRWFWKQARVSNAPSRARNVTVATSGLTSVSFDCTYQLPTSIFALSLAPFRRGAASPLIVAPVNKRPLKLCTILLRVVSRTVSNIYSWDLALTFSRYIRLCVLAGASPVIDSSDSTNFIFLRGKYCCATRNRKQSDFQW